MEIDSVCLADSSVDNKLVRSKFDVSDFDHGQYVAVMWKNKWTRGVVSMESQFLIWLIDYGIFLRPTIDTVYVNLPLEYRKYPSKVFEASVHGVTPVDKILTQDCQIKNNVTTVWNEGVTEKAEELIKLANRTHFVPIALLSSKHNDVVLGDLYLEMPDNHIVNLIDELETWPVFLEKNKEDYIKNLTSFYVSRRKHRACILKPDIAHSKLPVMSLETSLDEYSAICAMSQQQSTKPQCDSGSEDGSTVLDVKCNFKKEEKAFKLTHDEIKKYANMYVCVRGREYNVLNVLINKIRDLNMCERYKDHDLKSVGCGITHRRSGKN
ncbi:unnamed protein product [Parnassius apollo]|uniref:(apollo) hypothetical protein n=1 Tax=Parnassius apollo TaxID=110799 RepID=A0A8S3Y734_PARAO|nr:unnamed protein product [Parnassius apollo]